MWKRVSFFIAGLLLGVICYWFWPENTELPDLGETEPFEINTVDGHAYNSGNKKIKLLTFFYTSCPDICPLTIQQISTMEADLKEAGLFGDKVEFVLITIDPEVDSAARIKKYADAFQADSKGWVWLRGSLEKTKLITDQFKMVYQKQKDGAVSHGTTIYLLDGSNNMRGIYDMAILDTAVDTDKILQDIKILVNN